MSERNDSFNAFDEEMNKTSAPQQDQAVDVEYEPVAENEPVKPETEKTASAGGSYGIPTGGSEQGPYFRGQQAPQYRYQPPMSGQNGYRPYSPNQQRANAPYGYDPMNRQQPSGDPWQMPEYPTAQPVKKKKKGRVGKVVLGVFASVLMVAMLGFSVFGIYSLITEHMPEPGWTPSEEGLTIPGDKAPTDTPQENKVNENVPELEGSSKPSDNTVSGVDGVLTTAQINEKVAPSVVGIVQYQSNYFEATGEGSGIILSADGYIATNAHVIEGADTLEVVLSDGKTYPGTIVGSDGKTDLAVIKIEAEGLVPAELGISAELKVGEKAVAIGNPGGMIYAGSVSEGIVSGLNRSLRAATDGYTMNFIQTDAAISPGNSGGALVNEFGQVVGINSQKLAADGYEGIGFAIPIDEALPILEDLMRYGRVRGRVKLGITAYELNEYVASVNGVPSGILIDSVEVSSSLKTAGVEAGDIITRIEDVNISSFVGLSDVLRNYKPGDKVTLTVFRPQYQNGGSFRYNYNYGNGQSVQGETFTVTVTLQEDTSMSLNVPYVESED